MEKPVLRNTGSVDPGEAPALQTMTSWTYRDRAIVSRTTLEETRLRQRLLAAMSAAGTAAQVTWLPGYAPVEARTRPATSESYASAKSAQRERSESVAVTIADEGALIVNLAIIRARRDAGT